MIRINLIPAKKKKKAKPIPKFFIVLLLLFVISLAGWFVVAQYYSNKINDLNEQKRLNAAKIEELKKKIEEVEDYERNNKIFEERKKIIDELSRNQAMPAKVLDEMSARLTQGVWITSMGITGTNIRVSGVGFSNNDIVDYVTSLKKSPMFTEVALGGTSSATMEKTSVYTFTLSMKIKS